jgi:hypothetical protein
LESHSHLWISMSFLTILSCGTYILPFSLLFSFQRGKKHEAKTSLKILQNFQYNCIQKLQ